MQNLLLLITMVMFSLSLEAQVLEASTKVDCLLSDNTMVHLYKARRSTAYYYLPTNLRVSKNKEQAEFSFLAYDEDGDGKNDGAILHFLLKWGLEQDQEKETLQCLQEQRDSNTMIWGAANVRLTEARQWRIYHAKDDSITTVLRSTINTNNKIPSHAGSKWAVSFRFDAKETAQMENILKTKEEMEQIFVELYYAVEVVDDHNRIAKSASQSLVLKENLYELLGKYIR